MSVLTSQISEHDPQFQINKKHQLQAIAMLQDALNKVAEGGGEKSLQRHLKRGKLRPRERIQRLIDPGSHFMELSPLAAWDMYNHEVPSAGLITGVGLIHNRESMIIANDATVKGGTYFPITVKKQLRAQTIAMENRLPCVYLVDSGGANLPVQSEIFPDETHFGRTFYNQAQMSSQGLAQIGIVLGSSTAGGAYVPAMCDENIIVKDNGAIYLGGPPLVKAATGEEVSSQDLGGAEVHAFRSGVVDHYAKDENHAFQIGRALFEHLARPTKHPLQRSSSKEPLYPADELLGILPADERIPLNMCEVIARLVDESRLHEFKAHYGKELICGFAAICGYPIAILANNGILFSERAIKGAHFIQLAAQRGIPLLFLQNITGFMVGKAYEVGGIAKDGAKLVNAVATSGVPRFTVIVGNSYGAGNYGMCGRAYSPRFLWMWPTARIAVMGGTQAANVLAAVRQSSAQTQGKRTLDDDDLAQFKQTIIDQYQLESSAWYSTARIWDDGVISPQSTRQYLACAISTALNAPITHDRFGVFRM